VPDRIHWVRVLYTIAMVFMTLQTALYVCDSLARMRKDVFCPSTDAYVQEVRSLRAALQRYLEINDKYACEPAVPFPRIEPNPIGMH
jgi:hypothetical protein